MTAIKSGVPTLCGLAAIAFVIACVAHEAAGHGLACVALGGRITLLTSALFRCTRSAPLIDAAGTVMNLLVAASATFALGFVARRSTAAVLLGLIMAYSGSWGAGYLIFSALTNTGDLAYVLRDLSVEPIGAWRIGMGIAGLVMYRVILRRAAVFIPLGKPFLAAYVAAGLVGCVSVLFSHGPVLPALQEAAQESVLAPVGLLLIALRKPSANFAPQAVPTASAAVIISSIAVILAFWLTLGRGLPGA